jgi:hypothetical protein
MLARNGGVIALRLGHQDRCAFETPGAKIGERLIGLAQGVAHGLSADTGSRRYAQKV